MPFARTLLAFTGFQPATRTALPEGFNPFAPAEAAARSLSQYDRPGNTFSPFEVRLPFSVARGHFIVGNITGISPSPFKVTALCETVSLARLVLRVDHLRH